MADRRLEHGRSTGLRDIPSLGEDLQLAIRERELAGCATLPLVAFWCVDERDELPPLLGLSAPRLLHVSRHSGDEIVVDFVRRKWRRPIQVRPPVWWTLQAGDAREDALAGALTDKRSVAQLKHLSAAGLHDLCRLSGATIAVGLGYADEFTAYKAADKGRELLSALNAWPWACLPPGAPAAGWWCDESVRLGWQLWAEGWPQRAVA